MGQVSIRETSVRIKWAVGVTTVASRLDTYLPRTLESLRSAGFEELRIFADGVKDSFAWEKSEKSEKGEKVEITTRFPAVRPYGNFILGIAELYLRNPTADRFFMVQDDIECVKNMRQYMEKIPYPHKAYLNLLTYRENEVVIRDMPEGTWTKASYLRSGPEGYQTGRGACALIFSREAIKTLLLGQGSIEHLFDRVQDPSSGWRSIDGAVVTSMNKMGWSEYVHNPSLVQHIGEVSTIRGIRHPRAMTFKGQDWDAMSLLGK